MGGKTPYIPQGGAETKKTKDNVCCAGACVLRCHMRDVTLLQVVRQPPNMVTNPCKKGTYGVFGTYLGYKKVTRRRPPPAASCDVTKRQGYKGASGEFECAPKPEFVARNPRQHPPAGTYLTRYASLSASVRQLQTRPRRSSRRPPAPAHLAKLSAFGSTGCSRPCLQSCCA